MTFLAVTALLVLALVAPARAHEPVFSLGPETIFEGGVGMEAELDLEDAEGQHLSAMNYEIIYGLRENLSLTLGIPHILEREEKGRHSGGIGDVEVRAKYRLYKKDLLGAQYKFTAIGGVKVPTGNHDARPPLGAGITDVLFGATYGYESRTWYHFITARYRLRTESGNRNPGDRLLIDPSVGFRPWRREYLEWDLVVLLEASVEVEFSSKFKGRRLPDAGGDTIWLGPTALLSYRNLMFKGGVQLPAYEDLNGAQGDSRIRSAVAFEYHF